MADIKMNKAIDPSTFTETIVEMDIAELAKEQQLICGTNKNVYRYFPVLIDGLKPVERRLLYNLYVHGRYKKKLIKMAKAASGTVDYHPHGDDAIGEVGVGISQDWSNNVTLMYIPGNNGSITGEDHAALRYLDGCISDFAYDCYFSDFEDAAVDMKKAYTGEDDEPEYLPAKFPVLLINGGFSGIGYGFASNIPPYNFKEVCETTISLIKDPDAKVLLYPDLPSGADVIMTKKEAKEIFETGIGKVKMRAHADIDYINNVITFTSIPMQVSTKQVQLAIANMKLAGKFDDIKGIDDDTSDRNGVMISIYLKPEANPEKVLAELYASRTFLKKTNGCSITSVDDYQSDDYSIRRALLTWIEYRRDIVRSSFNNKIIRLMEERHLNEVIKYMYDHDEIDNVYDIAKKSGDKEEYYVKLMKKYGISSLQAKTVGTIKSTDYTQDFRKKLLKDIEDADKEIERISDILKSDGHIDKEIIRQLKEGIEKYGVPRKSLVVADENSVVDEAVITGITDDGYIKKIKQGTPIGKISKNPMSLSTVIPARQIDTIAMFDDHGFIHMIPVASLPLLKEKNTGLKLSKYIKIGNGKIISTSIVPMPQDADNYQYVMITEKGLCKRITVASLLKVGKVVRGEPMSAISLSTGDKLAAVICAETEMCDMILFTNFGDGIRLTLEDTPIQSASSRGAKVISLRPNEVISGASLIDKNDEFLLYVTNTGKVKRTELKYFPAMKRKDEPLALINLEEGEYLVNVKSAAESDRVIFYKKTSEPTKMKVSDIPIKTRAAKPEKMIKILKGDTVLSMIIIQG